MRILFSIVIMSAFLLSPPVFGYESLQELYEQAGSQGEYDKYLELDPETEYEGDLRVNGDIDVCLIGNGAVIYGIPNTVAVGVWGSHLDISGCVIVDAAYGIFYSTNSSGEIRGNTIDNCSEWGISVIYPDMQAGVTVWDNIVTNSYYGFYCVEYFHPVYLGYNTIHSTNSYRYCELCPS